MSIYSPGPWRDVRIRTLSDCNNPDSKWSATLIECSGGCVQQVAYVTQDSLYSDEANANIRLIVAAPDLLAACKVLALTDWTIEFLAAKDPRALRQLREAIAKAEEIESNLPPTLPEVPRNLVCPACGNDRMLYVEDIGCAREVGQFDEDGTLMVHGLYKTDGFDEGTNPRIQCSSCVQEFAVPEKVKYD